MEIPCRDKSRTTGVRLPGRETEEKQIYILFSDCITSDGYFTQTVPPIGEKPFPAGGTFAVLVFLEFPYDL